MQVVLCPNLRGPNQIILVNALISLAISDDLSADELNVIGNFIVAVGSLLLTKAAELSAQQSKQDNKQQIQELEEQVQKLKEKLH